VGAIKEWVTALPRYPMVPEQPVLPLRGPYYNVTPMYKSAVLNGRRLKPGEIGMLPQVSDRSVEYDTRGMFRTTTAAVQCYSAAGVLCEVCRLSRSRKAKVGGTCAWAGALFVCDTRVARTRRCAHDEVWPLPCIVQEWWRATERDYPLEALASYLTKPVDSFEALASLLAVGAMWG